MSVLLQNNSKKILKSVLAERLRNHNSRGVGFLAALGFMGQVSRNVGFQNFQRGLIASR